MSNVFDRIFGGRTITSSPRVPDDTPVPVTASTDIVQHHDATNLRCVGCVCRVVVEPHDATGIDTTIAASAKRAAAIRMSTVGRTLVIEDTWQSSGGGANITMHGNTVSIRSSGGSSVSSISIGGSHVGRCVVNGVDVTAMVNGGAAGVGSADDDACTVTVRMPRGHAIGLEGMVGTTTVGDMMAQLDVHATASGDVTCGAMQSAHVAIHGSSDVYIASVTDGPIVVTVQGGGDVAIHDGDVGRLDVAVHGSGDVTYGGTAGSANLSIQGSGDIDVHRVRGTCRERTMGSGDITVHHRG